MSVTVVSFFDVLSNAVWVMLQVSLPVLLVAMLVGLIIGIIQTATSIQEQTLIFIPKILAVFICLILLGRWMGDHLLKLTIEILGQLQRFIQ